MDENQRLAEEEFRNKFVTTYEGLLSVIESKRILVEGEIKKTEGARKAFHQSRFQMMCDFEKEVRSTPLFKRLDLCWNYCCTIGSRGVILHLQHWDGIGMVELEGGELDLEYGDCDAFFDLIKVESHLLSSEEYAARYGVSTDTIRMWIRRGKIPSAIKQGNSWRIPEASEPIERGFKDATFMWYTEVEDAPQEFRFISDPGSISIRKMRSIKSPFQITLYDKKGDPVDEKYLSTPETEKLESYLVSTPNIIYTGDEEVF